MSEEVSKNKYNTYFNALSKEVIQCLQDISSKKMRLNHDVLASMLSNNVIISNMFKLNIKELDSSTTELKHWKDQFLEQKKKCSDCNEEHFSKETQFKKILTALDSLITSSFDEDFNSDFDAVRKILAKGTDEDTLNDIMAKLTSIAKKHKVDIPDTIGSTKIDKVKDNDSLKSPLEIITETKKDIFYDFIGRLDSLLPHGADEINTIKKQIEPKYSIEKPAQFLNALISLFENERSFATKENEELRNTILMLLSELNETEKNVTATLSAYEKKVANDNKFADSITSNVKDIEGSFDISTDVKELQKMVSKRAQGIAASIKKKVEDDLHHTEGISNELKTLQKRSQKAQSEAERYKKKAENLEAEAYTDTLTDIPNRRALDMRIAEEHARFSRHGHPCSILVCDLDKFKDINDKYGHATGDTVLKKVAYLMKKNIRGCDFVGRYGGEEFMLILPDTSATGATVVADKIRGMIEESKFYYKKEDVNVTISIGVAQFEGKDSINTVFERADSALYEAKNTGRNKVVQFSA